MEEVSSSSIKRPRSKPEESPEAKRIRADVLHILADDHDDTDPGDHGSADEDLAYVMQSLQEEMSISLPATIPPDGLRLADLDYLLEASDDELGIPPTVPSPAGDVGSDTESIGEEGEAECGQVWGFGDDLDFQIQPEAADGVVMCGDGIFEYDNLFSGAVDFFDTTWRSELLSAM